MLELEKGFNAYSKGEYQQAINFSEIALKINPLQSDGFVLKGLCHFKLEQYQQCKVCLKIAHVKKPKDETVLIYLLESLINLDQSYEALEIINDVIFELSNSAKFLKVKLLESIGKTTDAIAMGESISEGSIQKYNSLATNYEKINEIELAGKFANLAIKINKNDFKANFVLSKILIRKKKFKKAKKYLLNIDLNKTSGNNLSLYYSLKAQINEKQEKFNRAFKYYTKSNRNQKMLFEQSNSDTGGFYSKNTIEEISKCLDSKHKPYEVVDKDYQPIFMVGFPRSGTTLLDQLLSSHTMIEVVEEQPMINVVLDYFIGKESIQSQIRSLSKVKITNLQNKYIDEISKNRKTTRPIVIDKLPLNMIHMSLIYQLFPNAKFIISSRDYRDVALSCYFQSFVLNQAMSYFLDWKSTNEFLSEAMKLTDKTLSSYPIKHIWVKYENLVDSPFTIIKDVLDFLDIDWQEAIKNYRDNIKGKTINTPSYSEVTKKIHKNNKNRWENYKKQTQRVNHFWN